MRLLELFSGPGCHLDCPCKRQAEDTCTKGGTPEDVDRNGVTLSRAGGSSITDTLTFWPLSCGGHVCCGELPICGDLMAAQGTCIPAPSNNPPLPAPVCHHQAMCKMYFPENHFTDSVKAGVFPPHPVFLSASGNS
jgi:hypothetical protein